MVDMYTDIGGKVLKQFLKEHPQFVLPLEKIASNEEILSYEELTNEAFADPYTRTFPIFCKTAAFTSGLYVLAQRDEVPVEVRQRVQEALDLFDIPLNVMSFEKQASLEEIPDEDFLLPNRKLPVVDKETFFLSQNALLKMAHFLPHEDKLIASRKLVKKAEILGIKPAEEIRKMALLNGINGEALTKIAENRFYETADERYLQLKDAIEKSASVVLGPLMTELFRLDEENNINDDKLLIKIAADESNEYVYIDNNEIPLDKIANIPIDEWTEVLPMKEIDYFFDGDKFNKEKFEKVAKEMTPLEKDALLAFIQKYL